MTGKQRMLAAYRGTFTDDRIAVAPEFWCYYPAKILGVDMIEFSREVAFHKALKTTFEKFGCEGWGMIDGGGACNPDVSSTTKDIWLNDNTLETHRTTHTPFGDLSARSQISRDEPGWTVERPIKDLLRDLPAWEHAAFPDAITIDPSRISQAWNEVGETYLLEGWLGAPFFDTIGGAIEGGLEQAVYAFIEHEKQMKRLQEKHIEHMVQKARILCEQTPLESFAIGCSWSCNSLIGPVMWRRWDKPAIKAICEEIHRHNKLLHVHFHGRCMETVVDFAEIGLDCVCPFERPPGGDIVGLKGLETVQRLLDGQVTMNGNIHTVETLIRGTEADVRREVQEVMSAFKGNPRVIVGTGDQVGRETPEENVHAMIDEAKRLSPQWLKP